MMASPSPGIRGGGGGFNDLTEWGVLGLGA